MFEQKMNDQMQDLALLDRKKLEPWVPSGFADTWENAWQSQTNEELVCLLMGTCGGVLKKI